MLECRSNAHRRRRRCVGPIAALLMLSFASSGCGKQTVVVWEKPGAAPGELEAAREICLTEMEALGPATVNRGRLDADVSGACFVACMKRHGFTWRTERVSTRDGEAVAPSETGHSPDQEPSGPPPAPPSGCPVPEEGGGVDGSDVERLGE